MVKPKCSNEALYARRWSSSAVAYRSGERQKQKKEQKGVFFSVVGTCAKRSVVRECVRASACVRRVIGRIGRARPPRQRDASAGASSRAIARGALKASAIDRGGRRACPRRARVETSEERRPSRTGLDDDPVAVEEQREPRVLGVGRGRANGRAGRGARARARVVAEARAGSGGGARRNDALHRIQAAGPEGRSRAREWGDDARDPEWPGASLGTVLGVARRRASRALRARRFFLARRGAGGRRPSDRRILDPRFRVRGVCRSRPARQDAISRC